MHLPSHTTNEHNAPENDTLQLQTANGTQTSGISSQRRNNGNIAQSIVVNNGSNNTAMSNNRRKNSLSYQQQQQLQFVVGSNVGVVDDESNCVSTAGRFSPHPNELYLHQAGKLSLPPPTTDRYNDATAASCCLPPPSPAPNSDRYIVNGMKTVTSANQVHHHYQQQQQTNTLTSSNSSSSLSTTTTNGGNNHHVCGTATDIASSMSNMNMLIKNKYSGSNIQVGNVQRALSPSSRYRLERYRDTQQQKASKHSDHSSNHHPSSTTNSASGRFYLPSNAPQLPPLVPSETYTYLTSTVHTPVKRYVPTPPPSCDNFHVDMPLPTAQSPTMLSTNVTANNACGASAQYVNTLPYVGYRMKCCSNEQHMAAVASPETLSTLNKSTQSSQCISSGSTTATTMGCSPNGGGSICKGRGGGVVLAQIQTTHPAHIPQQQHATGTEYANTMTTQQQSNHTSALRAQTEVVANTAGTCLHCNTARRTTGVHQTTQTTGPISPVPVSQQNFVSNSIGGGVIGSGGAGGVFCPSNTAATHEHSSVSLTPSTTESHISPLSPSMYVQQQPNNHQQQQQTQTQPQIYAAQQQQKHGNVIVTAGTQRLQQQQVNSTQQLHQHHHQQHQHTQQQQQHHQHALQTQQQRRYSRKKRLSQYLRKKIARFFGVEPSSETEDFTIWLGRHRRLALRRFGILNDVSIGHQQQQNPNTVQYQQQQLQPQQQQHSERPDILPVQNIDDGGRNAYLSDDFQTGRDCVERKVSVAHMFVSSIIYIVNAFNYRQTNAAYRHRQWSRSFAPIHVQNAINSEPDMSLAGDLGDGALTLMDEEMFFDAPGDASGCNNGISYHCAENEHLRQFNRAPGVSVGLGVYMSERQHGWRTTALNATTKSDNLMNQQETRTNATQQQLAGSGGGTGTASTNRLANGARGTRISAQLLDGVLENSRRPQARRVKYFGANELDDRNDHRPFFTYWINTVQIIVLSLSLLCYGIAPIGFGSEQKTGQVLVTSLSLQTVQHLEQRNFWIGPRNNDLVHMGAKFAACMRRDVKIIDVLMKTRRQERETACCIRNDDSGCVQSSQADCSVRGLFPTKSISTWKKWSPGESGPGGRISGSVCGLDPKFCDAPASIAPYEWPDDITKWPICRKTNSFSQRFRYKDHTAEHMVCEVIGHPCCTGVYGECRITTREYCDFVNGYFHEEASLCSQISCLNNVCGMFPFLSIEVPDQLYRLLTSLCMHAGILHLAITVLFQHIFLADLERLIGPIRTAVVYISSGLAGNLTSAVLVPYKPEVGPSAALCGVLASLTSLLLFMHWQHLHKPHVALFKLALLCAMLFGIGTLPYQLNFAGLLAGAFCGALLTISLIPFVSVNKYKRKSKINLIWSCVILHMLLFSTMTVVFFVFPMEFTNLNFGDGLHNNINPIITTNAGIGVGGSDIISSGSRIATNNRQQSQKPQFYYHHHSDDIIRNSAALTVDNKITRLIRNEVAAETRHNVVDGDETANDVFVSHSFIYTANNTNSNEPSGKLAYQQGNNDFKGKGDDDDFFSIYKNPYKQGNRTFTKFNSTGKNNNNSNDNRFNKAQRLTVAVVSPTNLLKSSKSSKVGLMSSHHFSSYNNGTAVMETQKIYKDSNKLKHFAGDTQNTEHRHASSDAG